jgi:hypothetical protein
MLSNCQYRKTGPNTPFIYQRSDAMNEIKGVSINMIQNYFIKQKLKNCILNYKIIFQTSEIAFSLEKSIKWITNFTAVSKSCRTHPAD